MISHTHTHTHTHTHIHHTHTTHTYTHTHTHTHTIHTHTHHTHTHTPHTHTPHTHHTHTHTCIYLVVETMCEVKTTSLGIITLLSVEVEQLLPVYLFTQLHRGDKEGRERERESSTVVILEAVLS